MAQIPQQTVYKHGNTNTITARRFVWTQNNAAAALAVNRLSSMPVEDR
jgi:hypothetical protein